MFGFSIHCFYAYLMKIVTETCRITTLIRCLRFYFAYYNNYFIIRFILACFGNECFLHISLLNAVNPQGLIKWLKGQTKGVFICTYKLNGYINSSSIRKSNIYKQGNMIEMQCRFYVRGIDFVHFYVFPIGFWHCSDSLVCRYFWKLLL